jgi:hypothetical protein
MSLVIHSASLELEETWDPDTAYGAIELSGVKKQARSQRNNIITERKRSHRIYHEAEALLLVSHLFGKVQCGIIIRVVCSCLPCIVIHSCDTSLESGAEANMTRKQRSKCEGSMVQKTGKGVSECACLKQEKSHKLTQPISDF